MVVTLKHLFVLCLLPDAPLDNVEDAVLSWYMLLYIAFLFLCICTDPPVFLLTILMFSNAESGEEKKIDILYTESKGSSRHLLKIQLHQKFLSTYTWKNTKSRFCNSFGRIERSTACSVCMYVCMYNDLNLYNLLSFVRIAIVRCWWHKSWFSILIHV